MPWRCNSDRNIGCTDIRAKERKIRIEDPITLPWNLSATHLKNGLLVAGSNRRLLAAIQHFGELVESMRRQYISLHSGTFSRKSRFSRTAGFSETLALEETMGLPGNGIEFPKRLNFMKQSDQLFAAHKRKE
jgi:hypothetical protein